MPIVGYPEVMGIDDGDTLVNSLRDVAADVGELLARFDDPRRRPATSQERRRLAERADRATASLDAICRDLRMWMSQQRRLPGRPERTQPLERVTTDAAEPDPDDPPEDGWPGVTRAQKAVERAREELQRSVEAARSDGATWRQIGEALEITAQTAHKRFDPKARRRHAEYMRERNQRKSRPEAGQSD